MPLEKKKIVVLGIPFDDHSSFAKGCSKAPKLIRNAFYSDSSNLWTEDLIDLGSCDQWQFVSDIKIKTTAESFKQIESHADAYLEGQSRMLTLGGDHSVTYPILRAYSKRYTSLTILHLDAHPDLYDELNGNRLSHACPFARIMEENPSHRLVQMGIRTMNGHQKEQAERFHVRVIDMKKIDEASNLVIDGPVYLSLDMDCLDPAFAPGVSHFEPGGLSTRQVLTLIQNIQGELVGADIVEYNPDRDINGMTAMVAAKLLKEILARMIKS